MTLTIHLAETRNALLLQAALDRLGFDLDAVAQGYISVPRILLASLPPDLDRLDGLDARKALFVRALLPVILYVNDQIGADRQMLLGIHNKLARGDTLAAEEVQWVLSLADTYDQADADVDALLKKVDVIPPSLALARPSRKAAGHVAHRAGAERPIRPIRPGCIAATGTTGISSA